MEFLSHGCFLGVQWRLFITWLFCVVGSMKIDNHMDVLQLVQWRLFVTWLFCSGFNGGCLSRGCSIVGSMEVVCHVVVL